ncbi:replication initiator protein [Apis mellifera associated microvirus 39]|nr:replication initiator protein [Apis mellifera associated microvirus 39]
MAGFGCGRCLPCRINRRRTWAWRMYLEALCHDASSFVTLTYAPENIPPGGNLDPRHLQLWLKRLRKEIYPRTVRFFAVGEYGDQTQRPHYHAALFGLGVLDTACINRAWGLGHTQVAELNQATAQYTAGYVVKKMTAMGDPRLGGRHPEFARMSLRPGIGAPAMEILAKTLSANPHGANQLAAVGDVPHQLQMGKHAFPLARYLRRRLRKELNLEDAATRPARDALSYEASREVCDLLSAALVSTPAASVRSVLTARDEQKFLNVKARAALRGKRHL